MLKNDTAQILNRIASDLKANEGNYQIGVGTVAARLLESLSAHPEMIEQLLAEYARKASAMTSEFHSDETSGIRARPFAAASGRQKKAAS